MLKKYNERVSEQKENAAIEAEISAMVEKKLSNTLDKALDDIFKDWK